MSLQRTPVLLFRAGARLCALSIEQVIETMRPLPVAPLAGTPAFVRGAAVIRGAAVPVVDLASFLGVHASAEPKRLVLVRCGPRAAALAVDAVLGVTSVDPAGAGRAPLLEGGAAGAVEALGALDRDLLLVLRAARIVPEEAWRRIPGGEDAA